VLVCDRSRAYQSLALECEELIVALCWAHVRRAFLKAARSGPELEGWRFTWVVDLRELYHRNATRLEQWEAGWAREHQASALAECHQALKAKRRERQERCARPLHEPAWHLAKQKVLSSLHNHWDGLTVCVERPAVAMDQNTAERSLRNPVVGRKNSYGSGSVWRAHCAALMWSVRPPSVLWGLNPHQWWSAFFQACAESGGQSPADLRPCVPWQRSAERRAMRSRPLPARVPALGGLAQEQQEPAAANTS
jgi:transposase